MINLTQAEKKLKYWQKRYQKEYKRHKDTWNFDVQNAATQCKRWRSEIERLKNV